MERLVGALNRAANSNTVVNTLLLSVFGVLSVRSFVQDKTIKELEAEKDALLKSNKGIKSTTWEWKQTLYAEAEANPLVPLATIKSIYGELVKPESSVVLGKDGKQEGKPAQRVAIL